MKWPGVAFDPAPAGAAQRSALDPRHPTLGSGPSPHAFGTPCCRSMPLRPRWLLPIWQPVGGEAYRPSAPLPPFLVNERIEQHSLPPICLCGSGQMATATGNRRRWPAQAAHPGPPNSSPPPYQTSCSAAAMRARSPAGPGKKAHSDRAPEAALGRAGSSGRRSISLGGRDGQAARLAMPAIARRPRPRSAASSFHMAWQTAAEP